MGELLNVKQSNTNAAVVFQDPVMHFAFSTPQGWLTVRKEDDQDTKRSTIFVSDVDGLTSSQVKVETATNWPAEAQVSPRAFADFQIKEWKRWVKEVTVRADSWKDTTINGSPAVSAVCDMTQFNGIKQTVLVTYGFVAGKAVDIGMTCADTDVETMRPAYQALVNSYKPL